MHGRPRDRSRDPATEVKDRAQAELVESLLADLIRNHRDRCYTKEALAENAKLVELNPEVYTAWNYRKRALKHLLDAESDDVQRKKLIQEELAVNERALKANIKSYGAWYHRRWVIDLGLSSLDHELALLKKLFKADARNFHAWCYRRYIVDVKGVPIEMELDYTTELLNENFSNYSAWHNRSALLSNLFKDPNQTRSANQEILSQEFSDTTQAFFIEPNDQSAWIYHTWLLDRSKYLDDDWQGRLLGEISMCRELLAIEKKQCKWAKLKLARMLMATGQADHGAEVQRIFEELMEIDPLHREYYKDQVNQSSLNC